MDPRIDKFIALFNTKNFFEAHEVLEELWLETNGHKKNYYKGLIQCAVAFAHLKKNNLRGAKNVYERACRHLNNYIHEEHEIDTSRLMTDCASFFRKIGEGAPLMEKTPQIFCPKKI